MRNIKLTAEERSVLFWSKVTKTPSCWLWHERVEPNGYARFWNGTRSVGAHVWAYEEASGPIPEGLVIDHVRAEGCLFKHCVRRSHLEAVTHLENTLRSDGPSARNARATHCIHGHPFDEQNTYTTDGHRHCRICRGILRKQSRTRKRLASLVARTGMQPRAGRHVGPALDKRIATFLGVKVLV